MHNGELRNSTIPRNADINGTWALIFPFPSMAALSEVVAPFQYEPRNDLHKSHTTFKNTMFSRSAGVQQNISV